MPLLKVEADKLTHVSLQRGVIEVLITRGAREILMQLPFKSFEGDSHAFNREKTLPTDSSARDPYGTSIPGGVGTRERVAVASGMLARNADTAKIDVIGKSNINNQRTNDIIMAAKKLSQDFVEQFVYGQGDSYNLKGLEYWMAQYEADFNEQKVFATSLSDVSGGAALNNLSLSLLNDLLTRWKGERFQTIYSDRETYVEVLDLLDAAGGNTAGLFMKDNYGEPFFAYRGTRWYVLDTIGSEKTATAGTFTTATDVVSITEVADPFFLGFSDLDVGRSVTVDGVAVGFIETVTDARTVVVSDPDTAADQTGAVVIAKTNAIYACRFDEEDGVSAIYHTNRGVPQGAGKYYGPIGGFDAEDLGLLENAPIYRTRLDWFGNFVQQSPYAVARLSHYAVA